MQHSLASLTDAVLRGQAGGAAPQRSFEDQDARQQVFRSGDAPSRSSASSIPIAPIQAVRNMNSWITGQRPDGRQDLPMSSTTTPGAAVDEKYIEV